MPYVINNLNDVANALNDIERKIDLLLGPKDIDLKKRKIKNAGPSKESYDYIVRKELQNLKLELTSFLDRHLTEIKRLEQRIYNLENP